MAKKFTVAHVNVPYLDKDEEGNSARVYASFRMTSQPHEAFCKRRVKRIVRKHLQYKLDKRIDIQEVRKCLSRGFYR